MIEFIKKWVAKEKVLINHCVQALFLPESTVQYSAQGIIFEESQIHLGQETVAAKKNKDKLMSLVHKGESQRKQRALNGAPAFSNLNSSKEFDDFPEMKFTKGSIDGGMTQDHFYKEPVDDSPWKNGDNVKSSKLRNVQGEDRLQPHKSLQ